MGLLAALQLPPPRRFNAGMALPPRQPEASANDPGPPALRPALAQAPQAWQQTQRDIAEGVDRLKTAVRTEFAAEAADLLAEIDQNLHKLDGVLDFLDDRLSAALRKASATADPSARANELANAKVVLANYIAYVRSEPLIAAIDANPFGVQIDLKRKLTDSLTKMALAIGR